MRQRRLADQGVEQDTPVGPDRITTIGTRERHDSQRAERCPQRFEPPFRGSDRCRTAPGRLFRWVRDGPETMLG